MSAQYVFPFLHQISYFLSLLPKTMTPLKAVLAEQDGPTDQKYMVAPCSKRWRRRRATTSPPCPAFAYSDRIGR